MATFQKIVGGYKIPSIGLGTFTVTDSDELEKALDAAVEAGYRHIDTAIIYFNESIIGRVLNKWYASGKLKREDIFITTKLPPNGNFPDKLEIFLKKSLENLQTDYIDLYLVHFPIAMKFTSEQPEFIGEPVVSDHVELWKALEKQVDAGRVKAIGISNFNLKQVKHIYETARIKPANLQVELHPYLQQKKLVDWCQQHNISVTGYGSLGRAGINDYYKKVGRGEVKLPAILEDKVINQIAVTHKKSPAQVILRYFIQKNVIMIPKSVTAERIKQNFNIWDFSLTASEVKSMENLEKGEEARIGVWTGKIAAHQDYPY